MLSHPIAALMMLTASVSAEPVTIETLLREMTDVGALAEFPDPPYEALQFSSYDRRSDVGPDAEVAPEDGWFANRDWGHFLRTIEIETDNGVRTERVLAEIDGPGVIARIWSANPSGTLRFYFDGGPEEGQEPDLVAPMADLLGGGHAVGGADGAPRVPIGEPFAAVRARGYNLYLPLPFAESCVITTDIETRPDWPGFYYIVNARRYGAGTEVETFRPAALAERLAASRDEAADRGDRGVLMTVAAPFFLPAGEAGSYALPSGPGVVSRVELNLRLPEGAAAADMLRALVFEAEFDGERTVWVPVGDFFGSGIGLNPGSDLVRQVTGDASLISLWRMPYKGSGTLRLRNLSDTGVSAAVELFVDQYAWTDRSMHLHATWREERGIPTRPFRDFNLVEIEGRGVYVGDQITVTNPVNAWWGEGDEKIYIDASPGDLPDHFGTGTEDYYGYAWCDLTPFEAPYHGQWQSTGFSHGQWYGTVTNSRVRALDAIPFERRLRADIEVWHWQETTVDYAATTYFYARPGATTNVRPDPSGAAASPPSLDPLPEPFVLEGAIEAEGAAVVRTSPGLTMMTQTTSPFAYGTSSSERHLFVTARAEGDYVELFIPSRSRDPRSVTAHLTRSWDYGIVDIAVNGTPSVRGLDLFNTESRAVEASGPVRLGVHHPLPPPPDVETDAARGFVVRIEVSGSNPRSEGAGTFFGIDCFTLAPGM